MAKLEELKQELEKKEASKGSGVVIADVLNAGIKYYAENLQKKEEQND